MRFGSATTAVLLLLVTSFNGEARHRRPRAVRMLATAFSVEGITAAGVWSRPGTAAADPAVLPLGSRIRVFGAGRYSGYYSVEDTGSKVVGRHIDLYMRTKAEAKRFGKQPVRVVILRCGETQQARR